MKVLLIGASGTIGSAVHNALLPQHEVITANHSSNSDIKVDLNDHQSIKNMFSKTTKVDAIICTAGNGQLKPLHQHSDEDFTNVLHNKLMGQVNVFRFGVKYLNEGGSVTLTTGRAHREQIPGSSSIAMATAALEGFISAASIESKNIRLNAVSPAPVQESLAKLGFELPNAVSASDTAKAYLDALNGTFHGQIIQTSDYSN
ncbi:short chain dehydrogenase [Pseudoalteromonas luteoviolacea]|uniref:short chain dehydrogenase n=1 Tax=Pseudoalteromonas luteoviolacea TaxID=43657 RepID=UPI001B36BCE4|nr:short chain dehydrogenase [Pseudoalteromonas luteoviolacea]MBQ4835802.1 short chain dehydrogenase [Pseudoalteromonas luteoviolacea]